MEKPVEMWKDFLYTIYIFCQQVLRRKNMNPLKVKTKDVSKGLQQKEDKSIHENTRYFAQRNRV